MSLFELIIFITFYKIFFPFLLFIKMSSQVDETQQNQEWIVVVKNKNKHKGAINNKLIHNKGGQTGFPLEHRDDYISKFISSKQFQANQQLFRNSLQKIRTNSNLIQFHVQCLGLGNFLTSKKSFIQLQFLQKVILPQIKNLLLSKQPNTSIIQPDRQIWTKDQMSINAYDPAFSKSQIKHIEDLGFSFAQKFRIVPDKLNVFFMPHCQRNLYEEVYEEYLNVSHQNNTHLIVIGNSIEDYKQRCTLIQQKVPSIFLKVEPFQSKLLDYENALNDTYILI